MRAIERTKERTNERTYERIDGWINGRINGRRKEGINEWTNEQIEGTNRMNKWVNDWTKAQASQSRKGQSRVELLQMWQSRTEGGALLGRRENVHCGAEDSDDRLQTSLFPANARWGGRSERERKLYARSGKYWMKFYVRGSQSGGVCGLGIVDVELRFVDYWSGDEVHEHKEIEEGKRLNIPHQRAARPCGRRSF